MVLRAVAQAVIRELAGFAPVGVSVSYGGSGGWGGAAALQLRVPPRSAARFGAAVRAENVPARLVLPEDGRGDMSSPGLVLLGLGCDYGHDEIHHVATAVAKAAHYLIEDSTAMLASTVGTPRATSTGSPGDRNIGKQGSTSALLLMAHGTKDPSGQRELATLLASTALRATPRPVALGVLEYSSDVTRSIQEAADALVMHGVRRIVAVPVLLLQAGHGKLDMPKEFALAQARHPDVDWRLAQPLMPHPLLRAVAQERVCQTIKSTSLSEAVDSKPEGIGAISIGTSPLPGCFAGDIPPDTAILLVGRGTHDANANADFFRIARLFAEEYGCPLVEVGFVSQTTPSVSDGLRRCAALGARRIVVVPYFLNTGILVRWIHEQVAATISTLPGIAVQVADHLGGHHHVVTLLLLRAREATLGVYALPCLAGTTGQGSLAMFSTPSRHQHEARANTVGTRL